MAKKNSLLDGLMDVLAESGSEIIGDVLEDLAGSSSSKKREGLLENSSDLLDAITDVVGDLTGLGSNNSKASSTAKKTSTKKSSSSAKKTTKMASKASKSSTKAESVKKTKTAKSATAAKPKTSSSKKKITT